MSNVNLSFLESLVLADNEPETRKPHPLEKVPTNGADLRLFKDGSVYPSVEFVESFNLEYQSKEIPQNAIDLVDSHQWGNYPKDAQRLLLIGFVERSEPKTDLFSLCKYNEGVPMSSVIGQGSVNNQLKELVNEIYRSEWEETDGFVDLLVGRGYPLTTNDRIYYVPKEVTRGKNKGETVAIRREYENGLYPLVLFTDTSGEVSAEEPETEKSLTSNL